MSYSIKTIVIRVDFTVNREVAAKKALGFADADDSIYLLQVQAEITFSFSRLLVGSVAEPDSWLERKCIK